MYFVLFFEKRKDNGNLWIKWVDIRIELLDDGKLTILKKKIK